MQSLKIGELVSYGWKKTWENWVVALGVGFLLILLNFPFDMFLAETEELTDTQTVIMVIQSLLAMLLGVAATRVFLNIIDGTSRGLRDLFTVPFMVYVKQIVATILYGIMVGLGLVALIIPGIYLAIKYQFYSELIIDKDMGILESIKRSGELTEGFRWQLFMLIIVLGLIFILGALFLGIGALVAFPVTTLAYLKAYRIIESGAHKK